MNNNKNNRCYNAYSPLRVASYWLCKRLYHEQENGRKWRMDAKLILFCAGKFVLGDVILGSGKIFVCSVQYNNCTPYMWASGLKPSHVGKFVVHGCDSWKCREFLCIIPKNFSPICVGGHLSEIWMLETPLPIYQSALCHIPEDHNLQQSGMLSSTYSSSFSVCLFPFYFITGHTHSVIF